MNASEWNATLPIYITKIIKSSGMKQVVVAERAGLSPQKFSEMLHGKRIIKASDIINISRALNVTPNEIFGFTAHNDRQSA